VLGDAEHLDSPLGQEHRGGQTAEAGPDHKHLYTLLVSHGKYLKH
jgi:hypothetical protein